QGRLAALLAKATPEQRRPLEKEIANRWRDIRTRDTEDIRRFIAAFGSLFAAGKEARLTLAERLAEENSLTEAELHLLQLRRQPDEPRLTARAVEALARLMTRKGLLEDAVHYYRTLGREFATVEVGDGKPGAALWRELATDPRFVPFLAPPPPALPEGNLKVEERSGEPALRVPLPFEPRGETLPFFQRQRVALLKSAT